MPVYLLSWHVVFDLCWIFFLLLTLIYFWRIRVKMLSARTWFKTKGKIIEFEWMRKGHALWPRIIYAYFVDEQEFLGEFLFLDAIHHVPINKHTRNVAYRAAHAFRYNHEIEVYYNPLNPEQAVLDIKIPHKLNGIILFIALLVLIHVTFVGYQVLLSL